jgi:hypothetical protein
MNSPIKFKTTTPSLFIALGLTLACVGFVPNAKATDTDGALPNGNNADGVGVLTSLTTGAWNSGFGYQALNHNTTGSLNTATGLRALFNNTEGNANTANGMMALFSNTTGAGNVAVGAQALVFNIDGVFNTAVGAQALSGNVDGDANNALGSHALFANIHSSHNTAIGDFALFNNDVTGNALGNGNTAVGAGALTSNSDGELNTAVGAQALLSNDTGSNNNALGFEALASNVSGGRNNAFGYQALRDSTGCFNTAVGADALLQTTGDSNVALGENAGNGLTTTNNNIIIGHHSGVHSVFGQVSDRCFIDNIYGAPVSAATATAVLVDSDGRLGTVAMNGSDQGGFSRLPARPLGNIGCGSSARFKENIKPMDKASESILALKPITFRYKKEFDAKGMPQFGLLAEEVAKVNPDLVVLDKEGKLYGVRYDQVNAMLLNEFLKEHRKVEEQQVCITQLKSTMAKQKAVIAQQRKDFQSAIAQQRKDFDAIAAQQQKEIQALTATLTEQAAQIQKVSAQIEASKFATGGIRRGGPAPQMVANDP